MIGEWFNEQEHPRDSKEGLILLKVSLLEIVLIFTFVCTFRFCALTVLNFKNLDGNMASVKSNYFR